MSIKAVVVFAEGFETVEALVPVDILRRAGYEVVVAGLDGLDVTSAHDVTVKADVLLSAVDYIPDVLVLPGGMPGSVNLGASAQLRELAQATYAAGKLVAAICAAPAEALAKFGLLGGKRATCFPGFEQKFGDDVEFCPDMVCVDGNIITARGAGVSFEFSYKIVELLSPGAQASELAERMLFQR